MMACRQGTGGACLGPREDADADTATYGMRFGLPAVAVGRNTYKPCMHVAINYGPKAVRRDPGRFLHVGHVCLDRMHAAANPLGGDSLVPVVYGCLCRWPSSLFNYAVRSTARFFDPSPLPTS